MVAAYMSAYSEGLTDAYRLMRAQGQRYQPYAAVSARYEAAIAASEPTLEQFAYLDGFDCAVSGAVIADLTAKLDALNTEVHTLRIAVGLK